MTKTSTALTRLIGVNTRSMRRRKRGLTGAAYERCRVSLKGLTEMKADPCRPGLAVAVAIAVRRAI